MDALEEAIKNLVSIDQSEPLMDGTYDIPAAIYKNGTDSLHSVNTYLESAELTVTGEDMTVKLNMQAKNETSWITGMEYSLDGGKTKTAVTETEADAEGHITSFRYTIPYSQARQYVVFEVDGNSYTLKKADPVAGF